MSLLQTIIASFTLFLGISINAAPSISEKRKEETNTTEMVELKITVTNLTQKQGTVRIALFADKDNWLSTTVASKVLQINNKNCQLSKCHWNISDLSRGSYAIAVYHDINNNGELDTNFIGFPAEPYGFSNNQTVLLGPPSWDDSKFSVKAPAVEHAVRLN